MIERLKERQSISPQPKLPDSSVAIFYFVLPHAIDALGRLMGKSTLDQVKDGFLQSGLKLTYYDGDKLSQSLWRPVYGEKFQERVSLVDSFIDCIVTHLKLCKKVCMDVSIVDQIKHLNVKNNLKGIEASLKEKTEGDFNLVVIANTPRGLRFTYGD